MSRPIKIDKIIAHKFRIPLVRPFRISVGSISTKEGVLIEGHAGDRVGWGEAAVDGVPFYTSETSDTAMAISRRVLAPAVQSREWSTPQELAEHLGNWRGHSFTKAAFEAMLWDLYGQECGKSVSKLLGGTREWVECGPSIGIKNSPGELVEAISHELHAGSRRIKIKVSPGNDETFLQAARKAYPNIQLMVDANSAYTPEDIDRIAEWDRFNLLMIEQPLDQADLYFHAKLCARLRTPVCLDESIETPHLARCAIEMRAADIVNIKVGRVGGLTTAKRVHDMCADANIPVWIGSRIGTGVACAMRMAAASLPNAIFPSDAQFDHGYLVEDICDELTKCRRGCEYSVPDLPGMGVTVDRDKLEKYTIEKEEL